jgi:hypothetical protein
MIDPQAIQKMQAALQKLREQGRRILYGGEIMSG